MMFRLILFAAPLSLIACGDSPEIYRNGQPKLDLRQFYDGDLEAWGTVEDWKGEVTERYTMQLHGNWQGNEGRLHETFRFDDGKTSERTWQLHVSEDGEHFTGTTRDVIGTMQGRQLGNALHMDFVQRFDRDSGPIDLTLDDTQYLIAEGRILNLITLRKFGLPVSHVTVAFHKL